MFENYFKTIIKIFKNHERIHEMNDEEHNAYLNDVSSFLDRYYKIPKKTWRKIIDIRANRFLVTDFNDDTHMIIPSRYFYSFRESVLKVLKTEIGYEPKKSPCKDHNIIREVVLGLGLNMSHFIDKTSLTNFLEEKYDTHAYLFDKADYESWIFPLTFHMTPPYLNLEYRDNSYFSSDCAAAVLFALDSVAIGYPFSKEKIVSNVLNNIKNKEGYINSRDDFNVGF